MYIFNSEKDESFSFWKNLLLSAVFFFATPVVLLASLFSLYSLSKYDHRQENQAKPESIIRVSKNGVKVFASLPANIPYYKAEVVAADARTEIVRQYLNYYNSPLEPFAGYIVQKADEYGVDFRLITAIAQQESNLCKVIPDNSFNCWGWGIHSQGTLRFGSYEEAIDVVTKGIKVGYVDKGYKTPEDIMRKYTPLSNGSWAAGVSEFLSEME